MPIEGQSKVTILALAFALFVSGDLAQAQLKFANFSTSQIKKCPASGKAKPPDAQRVNINGLPFSGAPWLKVSMHPCWSLDQRTSAF